MEGPRYTVIVPMRRFRAEEPVLVSLRETVLTADAVEILVPEGENPALQRNAALARARGEIIVFLDNDCRLGPGFWSEIEAAFARPEVEVVGGPALLRPEATASEKIIHALLIHPLVVGPVSARYGARGTFRPATQMELILCNLAVRKALFAKIGSLSAQLYPNEENEWLDRAQVAGAGIYYHPRLQVLRPQRSTWRELVRMLVHYGMGRTRQFYVSGWRLTAFQFLPLILLFLLLVPVLGTPYRIAFFSVWLAVSVIVALTCDERLRWGQRLMAGLAAPLIPLIYALGQLVGWVALLFPRPVPTLGIPIYNERGEVL